MNPGVVICSLMSGRRSLWNPRRCVTLLPHEWAIMDGGLHHRHYQIAVEQLTDVVYIELPSRRQRLRGRKLRRNRVGQGGQRLVFSVNGEVTAINEKLIDDPSRIAADPYGKGWMIKIKVGSGTTLDHLDDAGEVRKANRFRRPLIECQCPTGMSNVQVSRKSRHVAA